MKAGSGRQFSTNDDICLTIFGFLAAKDRSRFPFDQRLTNLGLSLFRLFIDTAQDRVSRPSWSNDYRAVIGRPRNVSYAFDAFDFNSQFSIIADRLTIRTHHG